MLWRERKYLIGVAPGSLWGVPRPMIGSIMDFITKSEFGEKNGTMIQSSKNAASWWFSFVCSLRVDPFRDVPGILVTKPIFMGGTPPPWLAALNLKPSF